MRFSITERIRRSAAKARNRANEFAAADTIYNFLTLNTDKLLRGTLNFMTFTTTLLMKKTPRLFSKDELVIQIDDSVIIHPLAMHMVHQHAKDGTRLRSMSSSLFPGIWRCWTASTTSSSTLPPHRSSPSKTSSKSPTA